METQLQVQERVRFTGSWATTRVTLRSPFWLFRTARKE
jgi:hypothetical protein